MINIFGKRRILFAEELFVSLVKINLLLVDGKQNGLTR
jgi:hypothetical protein